MSQTHLHETSRIGTPTERWEDRGGGGGRGVGDLLSETTVTEISGDGCTTQKHVLLSNTLAFILDRQAI